MSAEVEVIMASYQDVLTIPVAAVMETNEGRFLLGQDRSGNETPFAEVG